MSASREKKQRQGAGQNLSQKELKEARESQTAKRKAVLYWVVGIVAVVLVAALLIWNSNFFQSRATAVTINGHNFTAGEVEFYYHSAYQQEYYMAAYGMSSFSTSTDPKEQYVDEAKTKTYHDSFMDSALKSLTQVAALTDSAGKDNFSISLSESGKATLDARLAELKSSVSTSGYSTSAYLKAVYGSYMTESIYKDCLSRAIMLSEYQTDHQNALTYTDEDFSKYYDENKDTIDTYSFEVAYLDATAPSSTDADGKTVDATDAEKAAAQSAAKASAEALLKDAKAGGTFADLANAYVEKSSSNTYRATDSLGSSLASAYSDWLKSADRKAGDLELFESSSDSGVSGYYVVLFKDRYLDETPTADIRHILIKAELTQTDNADTTDVDESTVPTQEALDAAKAKAQALLDQWNAGDKTAESFGKLAEENSADTGSAANGGLISQVYKGQMFADFNNWIFDKEHSAGDTELIENPQSGQQGWHVIYFQDWSDPRWKANAKSSLQNTDMQSWLEELEKGYEVVKDSGFKYVQ